jgi:acetylornithine deacetylase/succinyl-diaminopimelate desuccinylase-like protein
MSTAERATGWIDDHRDDIVDFVLEFGNVPSPRGHEHEASEYLHAWMDEHGLRPKRQPVVEDRSNVVGRVPGSGGGQSLLFNAHLDTGFGDREEDEWVVSEHHPIYSEAWRDGDFLFGDDVVNDKGPMAAFLWAARAIQETGTELAGDLELTAVVGELGGTTVDEFQELSRLGCGIGARRLVEGGVTADYAVVAETTDYAVARMECGVAWFKVTIRGDVGYQPRVVLDGPAAVETDHPGALPRAARAALAIERWATEWSREHTREYDHGTLRPSAGVGAMRSGKPYDASWVPGKAALYVDVRLPPGERPTFVRDDIEAVLADVGVEAEVEPYLFRRGYVADDAVEPLVAGIEAAHDRVLGGAPPRPKPEVTSMWRDLNVFNEVGVPAVTVGPPRTEEEHSGTKHRCLLVDDLVDAAKLYAETALEVCG